ncbi:D-alanyl-D-alanine carboxypeptidase/D-alanyl-D-alanine-endopeptidase [Rhodobacter sp. Har01]|uniref:D-alanyl-D-alanine carboxypeptidase/D-alanyl-D-alanine endopeptidase n=1 Tax=Rhodobacter sp. Har01 TaxID=2883999 RepID=UPI001D092C57|nr:D-alanyl-D-alanine carboxypeptidase/D-alanyl-D-alanine-endopeptidase [Rhodobacter sp. Har01]MCB6178474.1 D-alanyl-D-alanine carboxypeptidase/D-alanyl-D-alanine-endopeptidase [Rhodobacter sp. Har01]
MISRRGVLAGVLAGAAFPGLAEVIERSPRPVPRGGWPAAAPAGAERLIAAAELGGTVAYVLADAATGVVLEARSAEAPLPPASVAKAVTALYALERLGSGHRFATRVLATGPIIGGIVQGDLVLAGGGDATLQTDQLGNLVERLAAAGLRGVTGALLFWEQALPALDRVSDDQPVHVGYNPAISGLCLNFNRVNFEWKQAGDDWAVQMDARGERFLPLVQMARMSVARRETPLFTYDRGPDHEDWTVASAALGKGGSRWLPVRLPGVYVAEVFRTLARAQGIELPPAAPVIALPQGSEIGRVDSEALPDVLRDMLKFSTNLTAECSGLAASGAGGLASSAATMTAWAQTAFGIGARFADHSGLGGDSRITASDMVKVLLADHARRRGLRPILRDVGMKDDKGRVIEGHPVTVLAKSGTLNFVSGLAGHIVPPSGREMVFAIFSGDPARRDAVPAAEREDPPGAEGWTKRARRMQGQLISRWATLYG